MPDIFVFTFKSDIRNVSECIAGLMEYIYRTFPNVSEADRFDLRLIFSELLYNAIIHGNKMDSFKDVTLKVEFLTEDTICAAIEDEGEGFNYSEILEKDLNVFNLCENGRGIQLVKGLCDHLLFNKKGNKIIFSKRMAMGYAQHSNSGQ